MEIGHTILCFLIEKRSRESTRQFLWELVAQVNQGNRVVRTEVSLDDRIFFGGGSYSPSNAPACAKLFVVMFEGTFSLVEDIELHVNFSQEENCVSSLKRFKDKQVLIAGTKGSVFIVEWTGTHLCILNQIRELHSSWVLGLECENGRVVTGCSKDNHINEIVFILD